MSRARVIGSFLSTETRWGQHITGEWIHFSVLPVRSWHAYKLLTAGQAMAAKRENFKDVKRALGEFTPQMISDAIALLEADHLTRSEKFVAPLKWLKARHDERVEVFGRKADNLLWRAIAEAPEGYCHPRASVTGSLLEDMAAGMGFSDVKARWEAKMHLLRYQRPQAAPTAAGMRANPAMPSSPSACVVNCTACEASSKPTAARASSLVRHLPRPMVSTSAPATRRSIIACA